MRQLVQSELNEAVSANEKRKAAMLRLILAAIDDRVLSAKKCGKDGMSDEDIHEMLRSMIDQRVESSKTYEELGQVESAAQEREEIEIIMQLMPKQLKPEEINTKCKEVIDKLGATGLRDMGRAMNAIKEECKGQMDIGRASNVVKDLLRCKQG